VPHARCMRRRHRRLVLDISADSDDMMQCNYTTNLISTPSLRPTTSTLPTRLSCLRLCVHGFWPCPLHEHPDEALELCPDRYLNLAQFWASQIEQGKLCQSMPVQVRMSVAKVRGGATPSALVSFGVRLTIVPPMSPGSPLGGRNTSSATWRNRSACVVS
jgi:hypothetical protein